MSEDSYDVVLRLRPPQIPRQRKRKHQEEEEGAKDFSFPVVDFDPVGRFLWELRESFDGLARFYYGGGDDSPIIGVKLEKEALEQTPRESLNKHSQCRFLHAGALVPNVNAMIDDFRVMGTGIVKDVEVKFT